MWNWLLRRRHLCFLRFSTCESTSCLDGGASSKSQISDLPPIFTVRFYGLCILIYARKYCDSWGACP
ncbi:hypothetical protein EI998_08635 [Streptococcus suis]|uniref:Uncharacterized protein n=1 Tax=Streptococcus suis TaxID=1307 RepID=A0A426TBL3_STRSU|nr:hypothetical protein EI998_08635 [Streptococcus suis]